MANFSSMFFRMNGRRERGGNRISETKDVTTVVKAAAMLFIYVSVENLKRSLEMEGNEAL
jgi:hypothetical protein